MRVIGVHILDDFVDDHTDLKRPAELWLERIRAGMVVFNLKGNKYRLVAIVDYEEKSVGVEIVGTHAEYSKWNLR